jgi:hypothetical protein
MYTLTPLVVFFAACAAGILFSLAMRPARLGIVLAWLGCLAAVRGKRLKRSYER